MTDLVTLMQQALIERLNTDTTREKIEKAADELIDDAIRETFKSYGDVGKKLKEVLVATIIPTGDLDDFPRYNQFVTDRIKAKAHAFCDERLAKVIDAEMAEIFGEIPERPTLTWLIDTFKAEIYKEANDGRGFPDGLTLDIVRDGNFFTNITLETHGNNSKKYEFGISHCEHRDDTSHGDIYTLTINGGSVKQSNGNDRYWGFEKVLYNLNHMKADLVLDKGTDDDDYDLELEDPRDDE